MNLCERTQEGNLPRILCWVPHLFRRKAAFLPCLLLRLFNAFEIQFTLVSYPSMWMLLGSFCMQTCAYRLTWLYALDMTWDQRHMRWKGPRLRMQVQNRTGFPLLYEGQKESLQV
jgi:hypothetical protein